MQGRDNDMSEIKWAGLNDIEDALKLRSEYIGTEIFNNSTRVYLEKNLNTHCYIALCEGVGLAVMIENEYMPNATGYTGKWCYVQCVFVKKEYRRRRVATLLMEMLIEKAEELGCDYLELKASRVGMKVYKKLGFRSVKWHSNIMRYRLKESLE